MFQELKHAAFARRYALCVGIGQYTNLSNHNLRYAVSDARAIAERLQDPRRGQFEVNLLIEPAQTTKLNLEESLYYTLSGKHLNPQDLIAIYLSCHGSVYGSNNNFYLLPSDAIVEDDMPKLTSVIDIHDLAKILTGARAKNIIFLLDACYSGGMGETFQYLNLERDLSPDTTLYMVGAARHDQVALQSSHLERGIFTHCLLQAFEQKPRKSDGWLTFSDIYTFISEYITSLQFKGTIQFRNVAAIVNPNILFVKNPRYSPQSLNFSESVRKLLRLVQYEPIEMMLNTQLFSLRHKLKMEISIMAF